VVGSAVAPATSVHTCADVIDVEGVAGAVVERPLFQVLEAELRRVSFIRVAQSRGLSLEEIRTALASLPENRTPDDKVGGRGPGPRYVLDDE